MKLLAVALLAAVASCSGFKLFGRHHGSSARNATELILEHGYPVQNCTVQTSDGYYLDIIRIPGGLQYKQQFEQQKQQQRYVKTNRPAVILMHGLLSCADDFLVGGPDQGLAYVLADRGFDVFLANARGSRYGRRHTSLNPDRDAAFWRFCWDEIGTRDLPAIIDHVLEVTQQQLVYYVGHSQGSTAFYVLAAERPEYNDKIRKMVALGPMVFMQHATNPLFSLIADNMQSSTWITKHIGANEFKPTADLITQGGQSQCVSDNIKENICRNVYFLVNGYSTNFNQTTIDFAIDRFPDGGSTRQILHYCQLTKTGRFAPYNVNYLQSEEEEYDLSKVTANVALMYVPDDCLSKQTDVEMLAKRLPNVQENIKFSQFSSNNDLLYANNVRSVVYDTLVNILGER